MRLLCRLIGHKWSAAYEEQCPLPYFVCERCGAEFHECNEIDWSRAAQRTLARRAETTGSAGTASGRVAKPCAHNSSAGD